MNLIPDLMSLMYKRTEAHHKHLHEEALHCLVRSVAVGQLNMIQTTQKFGFECHNNVVFKQDFMVDAIKSFFQVNEYGAPINLFLFITSRMVLEPSGAAVVLEKRFLKPDCLAFKYECSLKNAET